MSLRKKSPFRMDFEFKSTIQADGSLTLRGYASTYEEDRDREAVTPDALKSAVTAFMKNPVLLLQHDMDKPIGKIVSATVDSVGLLVEAVVTPPVAEWAQEAYQKIKDGVFKAFSIGGIFQRVKNAIVGMDLMEISVVSIPANPTALFDVVQKAVKLETSSKAVWSTAYINDLPDSCFAYIEDGGEPDEERKTTPRSLRHFPYKNSDGELDESHVRNAIGQIPKSTLPQAAKDAALKVITAAAKKLGIEVSDDQEKSAMRRWLERSGKELPDTPTLMDGDDGDPPEGSYEDLISDLQRLLYAKYGANSYGYDPYYSPGVQILATFPDYCVVAVYGSSDTDYYMVAYDLPNGPMEDPVLGDDREVDRVYLPKSARMAIAKSLTKRYITMVNEMEHNVKEGRVLSSANEGKIRHAKSDLDTVLSALGATASA